jgi:hypothetical protein
MNYNHQKIATTLGCVEGQQETTTFGFAKDTL